MFLVILRNQQERHRKCIQSNPRESGRSKSSIWSSGWWPCSNKVNDEAAWPSFSSGEGQVYKRRVPLFVCFYLEGNYFTLPQKHRRRRMATHSQECSRLPKEARHGAPRCCCWPLHLSSKPTKLNCCKRLPMGQPLFTNQELATQWPPFMPWADQAGREKLEFSGSCKHTVAMLQAELRHFSFFPKKK